MDLFWTFREPEAVALLNPEEKGYLSEFSAIYESLPWQPLEAYPHISEVTGDELSRLLPSATRLLDALERRTREPVLKRWWQGILAFLRSG
jgi:hypothetical protein